MKEHLPNSFMKYDCEYFILNQGLTVKKSPNCLKLIEIQGNPEAVNKK